MLYVALKLLQIQGSLRNNTEPVLAFEKIFVEKKQVSVLRAVLWTRVISMIGEII